MFLSLYFRYQCHKNNFIFLLLQYYKLNTYQHTSMMMIPFTNSNDVSMYDMLSTLKETLNNNFISKYKTKTNIFPFPSQQNQYRFNLNHKILKMKPLTRTRNHNPDQEHDYIYLKSEQTKIKKPFYYNPEEKIKNKFSQKGKNRSGFPSENQNKKMSTTYYQSDFAVTYIEPEIKTRYKIRKTNKNYERNYSKDSITSLEKQQRLGQAPIKVINSHSERPYLKIHRKIKQQNLTQPHLSMDIVAINKQITFRCTKKQKNYLKCTPKKSNNFFAQTHKDNLQQSNDNNKLEPWYTNQEQEY